MTDWPARNKNFVETFQKLNDLNVDGLAGEETNTALDPRYWPLKNLSDGRECFVTNAFNPVTHKGIDAFWWAKDSDEPIPTGYWTPYAGQKVWYPQGTVAVAAAAGKVVYSALISTGWLIRIQHANTDKTGYFHGVDGTAKVGVGDKVVAGQELFECGWMIGPNGSTEPTENNPVHIHFSVQRDGVYMDPVKWLRYATYFDACG